MDFFGFKQWNQVQTTFNKLTPKNKSPWVAVKRTISYELFTTMFTEACHWTLPWTTRIQSTSKPVSVTNTLTENSYLHLGLPCGLFPSGYQLRFYKNFSSFLCMLCASPSSSSLIILWDKWPLMSHIKNLQLHLHIRLTPWGTGIAIPLLNITDEI